MTGSSIKFKTYSVEIIKVLGKALIPVREKYQTFIFCHTLLKWRDQIYWGELFYTEKKQNENLQHLLEEFNEIV